MEVWVVVKVSLDIYPHIGLAWTGIVRQIPIDSVEVEAVTTIAIVIEPS